MLIRSDSVHCPDILCSEQRRLDQISRGVLLWANIAVHYCVVKRSIVGMAAIQIGPALNTTSTSLAS